jgi:hypothetical protein
MTSNVSVALFRSHKVAEEGTRGLGVPASRQFCRLQIYLISCLNRYLTFSDNKLRSPWLVPSLLASTITSSTYPEARFPHLRACRWFFTPPRNLLLLGW